MIKSSRNYPSGDGLCDNEATSRTFELLDGCGFNYPEADRVAAGSELRVRISKTQRPNYFSVAAYPESTSTGTQAAGDGYREGPQSASSWTEGRSLGTPCFP